MAEHHVRVAPIPAWCDLERLLGPSVDGGPWRVETDDPGGRAARAVLSTALAADLGARLRGLGLDGHALTVTVDPPLARAAVRRARTEDARRRRDTTPGFERAGVRLDAEGRWSLTPERLALHMAARAERAPIVDAGCGLGGNAIAFARAGCRVVAIEADRERLEHARHNAKIYQVEEHIRFVHGDAIELAPRYLAADTIVFVDPPWGVDWDRHRCGLADLPLLARILGFAGSRPNQPRVWAKVPASFDTTEIADARAEAVFGEAPGDRRRIKFVLLRIEPTARR